MSTSGLAAATGAQPRRERLPSSPVLPPAVVGMALLLFTEVMFFCGLISAYLVLRWRMTTWPPLGQPRLPAMVTMVNTIVLLASGQFAWDAYDGRRRATQAVRLDATRIAAALGLVFLCIQGYEWSRLIAHGITMQSGMFGSIFYTIVGAHALHVAGGLVLLAVCAFGRVATTTFRAARMYWIFVVALWPVIWALVYLW